MKPIKEMKPFRERLIKTISEKLSGYNYKENKFLKLTDSLVKMIEVQFLRAGEGKEAFSIHIGVHAPIVVELVWGVKDSIDKLSYRGCVLHFNVNEIMNSFKGKPRIKYWDLGLDETKYLAEVNNIIESSVLPFLEGIDSLEKLDDLIDATPYPKHEGATALMVVALKKLLNRNEGLDFFVKELISNKSLVIDEVQRHLGKK